MADEESKLYKRANRLSFMKVDNTYTRMTGFTQLTTSMNAQEYSRHYVDRETNDTDVVGYDPAIAYSFDRHTNNAVHELLVSITDGEKTGSDAQVEILTVDTVTKEAKLRTYAVVPDGSGDGTDALIYTGNFKSKSDTTTGTAEVSADGKTATFTASTT